MKREVVAGELASLRRASLPVIAAAGGIVVPAVIYLMFNAGGPGAEGWAVPVATDIAFALGVIALLGNRIPLALKIFLTALAIVDDIAAVVIIALFYGSGVSWNAVGTVVLLSGILLAINRAGVRHTMVYAAAGAALWLAVLDSGVHATVAGVVLGLVIPAKPGLELPRFSVEARTLLDRFVDALQPERELISNERQQHAVHALEDSCNRVSRRSIGWSMRFNRG